jgi:hypothetical protein
VGYAPDGIVAADFSHDGHLDLAVTNLASNNLTILHNNGAGTFTPEAPLPTGFAPYNVSVADCNGDGNPDLVVANGGSGTLSVFLGVGGGGASRLPSRCQQLPGLTKSWRAISTTTAESIWRPSACTPIW